MGGGDKREKGIGEGGRTLPPLEEKTRERFFSKGEREVGRIYIGEVLSWGKSCDSKNREHGIGEGAPFAPLLLGCIFQLGN